MNEFLAFVKKIGTTLNGDNIYEFMFTTDTNAVWGENFNIIPAGIVPNLTPEINSLSRKARLITNIDFHLACESTCFSMMDCIDNIIALCFTPTDNNVEMHLNFGDSIIQVQNTLQKHNLQLIEFENIQIQEDDIINDVIQQLEESQNNDDDFD